MNEAMDRFVEAASRLPAYAGVVWRAADFELTAPFTTDAPIPTSRDLRVATDNFRVRSIHLMVTTSARDIGPLSAHPSDQEVVLLPGARLVPVSGQREIDGLRIQSIIEQPGADQPLPTVPTDDEILDAVRAARSAGVVVVNSPGRFGV